MQDIEQSSDDLAIGERIHIEGQIIEVPDELLESSRMNLPSMS